MHLHRYEKIWLMFGGATIVLFLFIVGIHAFAMGHHLPSDQTNIDPTKVDQTPPFNEPGLKKIGENKYQAVMVLYAFGFEPNKLEIPAGATVEFLVTSRDVVHGFAIPGTNVNMMVLPGHVNKLAHTFTKPGSYLILCNEYCGLGHEYMGMRIEVTE